MLSRVLPRMAVLTQVSVAGAAFLGLALAPPAEGTMVLMPVGGTTQGQMATIAIDHGARIVARGRWGRSIVVRGERTLLWRPMAGAGVVMVAGTVAGCVPGAAR